MNKNDEVYMTLLKAKEKIAIYAKEKVANKNWQPIYNGLVESLDDIIADYAITVRMSYDEIMNCYFEIGADSKDSIFHDLYCTLKKSI